MRILIVDDDAAIRTALRDILSTACFATDEAPDGRVGSYLARTNEYDLIIMDSVMPEMNGHDACSEIRNAGITTPILFLSVETATDTKIDALDAGADDYLAKPFSTRELLARIRALLRRPRPITADVLTAGTVTVNTRTQTAAVNAEILSLTRKEFMILTYLLRNCGAVLSRAMIMEHVWDINADPFSNTLESHISSLRKKLTKAGAPRTLIRTVPGRGYIIDAPTN